MHKAILVIGIASVSLAAAVFFDTVSSPPVKKGKTKQEPKVGSTKKPEVNLETKTKPDPETDKNNQPTPLEEYKDHLNKKKKKEEQQQVKAHNKKHAYKGGNSRGARHLYLNRRAYEKARILAPVVSLNNQIRTKKHRSKKSKSKKTKSVKEYPKIRKTPKQIDIDEETWEATEPMVSNNHYSD
jgi:hypothetical protein